MLFQYCYCSLDCHLSFAAIFKDLPYCLESNRPPTLKIESRGNEEYQNLSALPFQGFNIPNQSLLFRNNRARLDLHNIFQQRQISRGEISVPKYSPPHANHTSSSFAEERKSSAPKTNYK